LSKGLGIDARWLVRKAILLSFCMRTAKASRSALLTVVRQVFKPPLTAVVACASAGCGGPTN
jgi:hypothetical protein